MLVYLSSSLSDVGQVQAVLSKECSANVERPWDERQRQWHHVVQLEVRHLLHLSDNEEQAGQEGLRQCRHHRIDSRLWGNDGRPLGPELHKDWHLDEVLWLDS